MMTVLLRNADEKSISRLSGSLGKKGLKIVGMEKMGKTHALIETGAISIATQPQDVELAAEPKCSKQFRLASREMSLGDTVVKLNGGVEVGGRQLALIAGPCSVESEEQLLQTAIEVQKAGAQILRGSVFKPRTSPYDFQGLGVEGLSILESIREETGMLIETEVMEPSHVKLVEPFVDMLRIGSRNMQNFELLREAGRSEKPVILKRGLSATVNEFLLAAEYILSEGNPNVILCERGIRTFMTETRNTLDLNCVPLIKALSHLPVIVDPSHGTGKADLVLPMSKAGIAVGADGLMIEVHPNPKAALSDNAQQLTPSQFADLVKKCVPVANAVGRTMRSE
ncbi:3-deoxy-7-phosphoheptulonate synthase [Candidatus Micrarchaeota archaeon]|nr:3-deoxy-7-phosphoheptulonate synthase [Candidatus Micrarchaeota archaeon]MBI5176449.1 3-deoxy-7-phosphoheptulonate synthase [Candidatus Micrarchaeota archaeon]